MNPKTYEVRIEFRNRARKTHEYHLGPGPCGRTVIGLSASVSDGVLTVTQVVEGGEFAYFHYPLANVVRWATYNYPNYKCVA